MNPGIYTDLSNLAYHGQTDWVSSTMLKRLLPEYYGPEPTNRKSLWFGSAFHSRVLGGPSEPWSVHDFPTWDSKAAKEAALAAESAGEVPVLARDVDFIDAMADALENHSEASNLIYGTDGQSEVSVFAEVDSVPMRARFDRFTETHEGRIGVDVKTTTEKPNPHDLARAIIKYGYDLSADHYRMVGEAAGIELDEFYLIFVCKEPPHHVTVANLHADFWNRGAVLRDLALERYLHPEFTDSYPGERERLTLTMPKWAEI